MSRRTAVALGARGFVVYLYTTVEQQLATHTERAGTAAARER